MHVLTDLDIQEISQVHRGAQMQQFLMTKSDDTQEGEMTIEAILKTILEGEADNESEVVALLEKSGLTEQEVLHVKSGIRLLSSVNDKLSAEQLEKILASAGVEIDKQELTTAAKNKLPDAAFSIILPGGEKDDDGLTIPRNLRKLPHHTSGVTNPTDNGTVDRPLLRNALARVDQLDATDAQIATARKHLEAHARELLPTSEAAQEAEKSDGDRTTKGEPMADKKQKDAGDKSQDKGVQKTGTKEPGSDAVSKDGNVDLSKLDDNVRPVVQALIKQNEGLTAQNERLAKMLGDITDEIRTKQYTEKAASDLGAIPGTSEDLGAMLKSLHDKDQELAKKVEEVLKGANAAIKKGGLFSELGSTGGQATGVGGEAWEQVNALAEEMRKSDPKLSKAQAIAKVAEKNPQLYTQHRAEKQAR